MKTFAFILLCGAVAYAYPQGQGNVQAGINQDMGKTPVLDLKATQQWLSKDGNSQIGLSGNHMRELGGLNRHETSAALDAAQKFKFDRGSIDLNANHNRQLFAPINKHQTNAGARGTLDVFRSDDGRTKGSVFGGASQQWNSHSPNVRSYEYGGRLEHSWRG